MIQFATIINVIILISLLIISTYIFFDSFKNSNSFLSSLLWAIIALFFFPPIGIGIYFYKRKSFLKNN